MPGQQRDTLLDGPGEVLAHLRDLDWTRCAIGAPSGWTPMWRAALRTVLDSGSLMSLVLGAETLAYFYNDAAIEIQGAKHPWTLGRPAYEVWPEAWPDLWPAIESVFVTGRPLVFPNQPLLLRRRGNEFLEEVFLDLTYNPLRDADGAVFGMYAVGSDMTARLLAERRLECLRKLSERGFGAERSEDVCRAAAAVLADAADVSCALLYLVDARAGVVRLVATARVPEPRHPELRAELSLGAAVQPPGALAHAVVEAARLGTHGTVADFGALVPSHAVHPALALPIADPDGGSCAAVLVALPTPTRPLAEVHGFLEMVAAQLSSALGNARAKQRAGERAAELAALDRAKTTFFSNVSHELRTPLTLLLGPLTEVLASQSLQDEDRKLLELARRGASRLHKLIRTLLDFSRVEAGRVEVRYQPTDLTIYTRELASMFDGAFAAAGVRFVVDARALPELVLVDRDMWEKIVLNLLSNALKFTFEGEVRLSLRMHEGVVRLSVSDTGAGIAAEHLPHVFERFYRAEAPRARTREGSGIGLSLVRELASLHGGKVAAESTLGRGTTVHVDIPLGSTHLPDDRIGLPAREATGTFAELVREEALGWLEDAAGPPAPSAEALAVVPTRPEDAGSKPRRVLPAARIVLADDNAYMRSYLRRILSARWEVTTVADGHAALALARQSAPDLIIADVMMPGLDGFALIAALRASPTTASIPVLLVSARAGEEVTEQALTAGAADYVVKPFSARELVARVQVQLTQVQLSHVERSARELAERESRARERFLAVLAHELRAPLTAILGWAELLRAGRLGPDDARRALGVIEQSVDLQRRLIEDLLDVSRIVAGRLALQVDRIDSLSPRLEAVLDSFRLAAAEKDIRIEASIEPSVGPLQGDAQRLQQVASNLLGNAIKFTPSGGAVRLRCERRDGMLTLTVSDTGKGIAVDALPHVFDDFWLGEHAGRRGGLGLGLAIAHSIVTRHGGTLHAESPGEGLGATFTVRVPLAVDA